MKKARKLSVMGITMICTFLSNCLFLSSCTPADEYPFSPTALEKHFGDTMEEVVEDLKIDLETAEVVEQSEEQTDITVRNVSVGENVTAIRSTLRFYNNVFYSLLCSSGDRGFIYDQTIALYELGNDKYGEEMTGEKPAERNILRVIDSKPSKEEFVNCTEDTCAYVATWMAENKRVSEALCDGEAVRFNIKANSITDNGEKWATLGMSFKPLYFGAE